MGLCSPVGASLGTVGGRRAGARPVFLRKSTQHRLFYGGAAYVAATRFPKPDKSTALEAPSPTRPALLYRAVDAYHLYHGAPIQRRTCL
jgi:hypothetical protein